jgi:DNA-binding PadR family transcriptional regulator
VDVAKPRKYYQLSDYGRKIYDKLCDQWVEMVKRMDGLIKG